jgi:hypothetical protein
VACHSFDRSNGQVLRFPIQAGTAEGDRSVKEAVTSGLAALIAEHQQAIESFGNDTRDDTLSRAAEKIRKTQFKIQAYAEYLAEEKTRLIANWPVRSWNSAPKWNNSQRHTSLDARTIAVPKSVSSRSFRIGGRHALPTRAAGACTRRLTSTPISGESIPMKVFYINNQGGGFADQIEIDEGTTVTDLFAEKMAGRKADDFLIRVNRLPVAGEQMLQPGDRISITPTKVEGAIS